VLQAAALTFANGTITQAYPTTSHTNQCTVDTDDATLSAKHPPFPPCHVLPALPTDPDIIIVKDTGYQRSPNNTCWRLLQLQNRSNVHLNQIEPYLWPTNASHRNQPCCLTWHCSNTTVAPGQYVTLVLGVQTTAPESHWRLGIRWQQATATSPYHDNASVDPTRRWISILLPVSSTDLMSQHTN
jgi:hypothetical protein